MRKIVFFDRELSKLGGHYINLKLHHFFSLFLWPFYVFVQKGSSQCTFWWIFLHSVHFGEFFFTVHLLVKISFTVYVLVKFSSQCTFWWIFSMLGLTLSNFSLTAKIRCNINSTIGRVCYISKENFRKSFCKTILFLTI